MRLASLNIAIESVTPIWSAKKPLTAAMTPSRAITAAAIPMVTISKDSKSKRAKTNEDGAPILRVSFQTNKPFDDSWNKLKRIKKNQSKDVHSAQWTWICSALLLVL